MDDEQPRRALADAIRDRGESCAGLSRWLGRNAAYLQQYIKRGTPRRLPEVERRALAGYLGASEAALGGPPVAARRPRADVRRLSVRASAGPGRLVADGAEPAAADGMVDDIVVQGDSMTPLLLDGDTIRVDRADAADRLRDGIYVLRTDDGVVVKRVGLRPGRRAVVASDNPLYPPWPEADARTLDVIGRVVRFSRRVG